MFRTPSGKVAIAFILIGAVLLAGPTFGFSSIAADRGVMIAVTDDPNAYLGVIDNSESTAANIQNKNDESLLYYLNDNTGAFSSEEMIDADAIAFEGSTTGLEARVEADSGSNDFAVIVSCGSSNLKAQGSLTIEIAASNGDRVELQRTTTDTIDVSCRGGGNAGNGFDSVRVQDVDSYTSPGDDRQEFAFTPSSKLNSGQGEVRIDLNDPHPESVNYEGQPTYYPDVTLEQGSGSVAYDSETNEIVYTTGSQDKSGNEIVISVGDYVAYGPSGPHEVTFTRTRTGEQGNTFFNVVDTGTAALENVSVSDVNPNVDPADGDTQTVAFTFGLEPSGSDQLTIDLSDPQGNGVDYTGINWDGREVSVEQGRGSAWYQSDSDEIRYQAADEDTNGDRVILHIEGYATADSGGPYEIPIYWERPNAEKSDTFKID